MDTSNITSDLENDTIYLSSADSSTTLLSDGNLSGFFTANFVICGLLGFLCLMGLILNTISWFVLKKDTNQVAAFQLQALAISDNAFLMSAFLVLSVKAMTSSVLVDYTLHTSVTAMLCFTYVYILPFCLIAQMTSVWLIVLIAMTRYIAVCVPLRASTLLTMKRNKQAVTAVILFSFLYGLPVFFNSKIVLHQRSNITVWSITPILLDDQTYVLVYENVMFPIFTFILPLVLLTFLTTRLILTYRKAQKQRAHMIRGQESTDNNLTLTMIILVLVFVLCYLPFNSQAFLKYLKLYYNYRYLMYFVTIYCEMLFMVNSSTNFFIYCFARRKFRKMLSETMCCSTNLTVQI